MVETGVVGPLDLKLQRVPGAEALRCPRTRGIWGVEDSAPGTQFQIDPLPSYLMVSHALLRYRGNSHDAQADGWTTIKVRTGSRPRPSRIEEKLSAERSA